jgi:hypothetical protein
MTQNAQSKSQQQEVVEKKNTAVVDLASFEADASLGLQGLQQDDLKTPRIKILMNGSDELDADENLKMGQIYNDVTGEAFDGKEGIIVVPCAYQRQYAEWLPTRGKGNPPVNTYSADSDILTKTNRSKEDNKDYLENGNYIETNANHFVIVYDSKTGVGTPALITMKATQLKKSRKWNSMMLNLVIPGSKGPFNPPSFSHMYKLKVKKEDNEKGKWFGWDIELVGPVTDMELYNQAKVFHSSIKSGDIQAKPEQDQESSGTTQTPF